MANGKIIEIWQSPDGSWTWEVLRKYQKDDNKPYARWLCKVKTPFTFGSYDIGDTYVADIKKTGARKISPEVYEKQKKLHELAEKRMKNLGLI